MSVSCVVVGNFCCKLLENHVFCDNSRINFVLENQDNNKNVVFSSFPYHCVEVVRKWVTIKPCFAHVCIAVQKIFHLSGLWHNDTQNSVMGQDYELIQSQYHNFQLFFIERGRQFFSSKTLHYAVIVITLLLLAATPYTQFLWVKFLASLKTILIQNQVMHIFKIKFCI